MEEFTTRGILWYGVVVVKLLAQFSLNNVHKRGLKHHHFISFRRYAAAVFEET